MVLNIILACTRPPVYLFFHPLPTYRFREIPLYLSDPTTANKKGKISTDRRTRFTIVESTNRSLSLPFLITTTPFRPLKKKKKITIKGLSNPNWTSITNYYLIMDEADSQTHAETPAVPQRSTPPPPRTATPQPPNHALSLSLPVHNTPPAKTVSKTANGSSGDRAPGHGRDDCWSEGATNTLIEAWGTRYLELNRGNLKQKHWKDVADAVSNRENGTKPPKTDVQCKNRLDTLKKKYKLEKNKMVSSGGGGGGGSSKWAFFNKLDELIGPSRKHQQHPHHQPPPAPPVPKLPTPPPMKAVPIKHRAHVDEVVVTNPQPPQHLHHHLQSMVMPVAVSLPLSAPMNLMIPNAHMPPHLHVTLPVPTAVAAPNSASSKSDETPDTTDSYPNGGAVNGGGGVKSSSFCKKRKREDTDTEESPLKDLTRAIMKFGEIYERVESSKMQQLIDLEKQRMVFLKDLEIQRMEYFMQAHVEVTKLKQEGRHQQRSDEQREHNNNNNNGNHNDNTGKHIESPPERIATPNSNSNCCLSTNSVVVSETPRSSQFMLLL